MLGSDINTSSNAVNDDSDFTTACVAAVVIRNRTSLSLLETSSKTYPRHTHKELARVFN